MPFITLEAGLTIKVPTRGTTGWDQTMLSDTFQKISAHDHSGSGNGTQIPTSGLENDSVNDLKIRLRNDNYLRSRNAANDADISILKVDTEDEITWGVEKHHYTKSFSLVNNQSSAADITDLSFSSSKAEGAIVKYTIKRDADSDEYETGILKLYYNGSEWDMSQECTGTSGIEISITSAGQLQYTSTDLTGHNSSSIKWSAESMGV